MDPDVIIIGTGQAAVPLARRLVDVGKRVALIERSDVGGTCVNTGCTPTKTLIASARAAHVARTASRLGVHARDVRIDLPAIVERRNAIVQRWREGAEKRIAALGDRGWLVRGSARFRDAHTIEVEGAVLRAEAIVIDVGMRPSVPSIRGLAEVPHYDSTSVQQLTAAPEHLLILGGGYIGCELGQMFRRFGSRVTIFDSHPHLLAREDPDVAEALERVFRSEGIQLELGAKVERVAACGGGVTLGCAGGREVSGSHLLVAVGRTPNTDGLGCEAAGIRLDERGFVVVDDGYATSADGVYAVGDVTGGPAFTHAAWDDHRLLFDRLVGLPGRSRSERLVPYAVFTDPQVAGVGLSEREAKARGIAYEVATMSFGDIARAIEVDETAGTMKLLLDPTTQKILGVQLVGAEAGELIHVFVVLMQAGADARTMIDAEFVHPTFAEGLQSLVTRLPRFA